MAHPHGPDVNPVAAAEATVRGPVLAELTAVGVRIDVGPGAPVGYRLAEVGAPHDREAFEPVTDSHGGWPKPNGGLWVSPGVVTDDGAITTWTSWLAEEGYTVGKRHAEVIAPTDDAITVRLSTRADVAALRAAFPPQEQWEVFSFEKARDAGIDAVSADQALMGFSEPLNGWDVDSTVYLTDRYEHTGNVPVAPLEATQIATFGEDPIDLTSWWDDEPATEAPATL